MASQKGKCYKMERKRDMGRWGGWQPGASVGWRDWWEEKQQARVQEQRLLVDINNSQWEDIEKALKAVQNAGGKTSS